MIREQDLTPHGKNFLSSPPNKLRSTNARVTLENIDDIGFEAESEREFARLLLTSNPNLEIIYEPEFFTHVDEEGKVTGTLPDFSIRNPKKSGRVRYVEITTQMTTRIVVDKQGNPRTEDSKLRQKEVMSQVAPEAIYIVFYRENLSRLQTKHPTFQLLSNGQRYPSKHHAA